MSPASILATDEMTQLGITRVPAEHFHYKQFRYTNLADAIRQAKRDQERESDGISNG